MYTTHHPCWDAKNRFGLPGEMPFDYAGIAHIIGDEKNISENFSGNEPFVVNFSDETPDKCKDVSDAPAQAAVSEPAKPDGTVPDIPAGIPQALRDLMQANNVTATDIQTAVSAKGYFPLGMEITDYPADFVSGCLIGAWDQLYQVILKERKDIPFLTRRTIIMNDNILDQELGLGRRDRKRGQSAPCARAGRVPVYRTGL